MSNPESRTEGPLKKRSLVLHMMPKNSICAEVGVHRGKFSTRILDIVQPRRLHLIDPWKHETTELYGKALYGGRVPGGQPEMDARFASVCSRFQLEISRGQVVIHRGPSSEVLGEFPDNYFDWVYIDGNHLYEFVRQDLELSYQKVKPGGYITGDDYSPGGWWQGGVMRAVDEFVQEYKFQSIDIRYCQYILLK